MFPNLAEFGRWLDSHPSLYAIPEFAEIATHARKHALAATEVNVRVALDDMEVFLLLLLPPHGVL